MTRLKAPAIITLTTDFGLADHYAGTMKGVLLGRCPSAQIVDISHEIPRFSIEAGAYTISQAAPYFPAGTIHVVVVDPGVGTARKAILVEAIDQVFIAPDNGVLGLVTERDVHTRAREIANVALWLPSPSHTFHGRDVFAPVAAALASGAARPDEVGPVLRQIEQLAGSQPDRLDENTWRGKVLSIDHFGNVITNFPSGAFPQIAGSAFKLEVGNHKICDFQTTFGVAARDRCFAYFGSAGYVELGMNRQSAAAYLGVLPEEMVLLRVTIG
jgi:S-adenosylmethionine hydrolase